MPPPEMGETVLPLPVPPYERADFAADVLDQGALGEALPPNEEGADRVYLDDGSFWADLRGSDWHRIGRVRLVGFVLTEWLPLSPGRYHHPASARLRCEAQRHSHVEHGWRVYDLAGKVGMVMGGVGSLRMAEHDFSGQRSCLLGASSSGHCDTGIPVLFSGDRWDQARERLARARCALRYDLVGRLRPIPDGASLYKHGTPLVSAFLQVEEDDFSRYEDAPLPQIRSSFAIMFGDKLAWEHYSFATFKPGSRTSLQRAVEWLRDRYGLVQTDVLNDFDEQEEHFRDATVEFALSQVVAGKVNLERVAHYGERLGFDLRPSREVNGAWFAYDRGLRNLENHLSRLARRDYQEVMPCFKDLEDRLRRNVDREQALGISLGLEAERRATLTALNDLSRKRTDHYFTELVWRGE
jgi:hypothetical protein